MNGRQWTPCWLRRRGRAMLWEVEILPKLCDPDRDRVCEEFDLFTHTQRGREIIARTSRGYLLEGSIDRAQVEQLTHELLIDPLAEMGRSGMLNETAGEGMLARVLLRSGVMDPAAQSIIEAARDSGIIL